MAYPTDRLLFWRTDSSTGGDGTEDRTDGSTRAFASLSAAIAYVVSTDADLTGNGALTLRCTQGGVDTTIADIQNLTTTASDYLQIECTGDARHNGVSREKSGTGYQLKTTATTDVLRNREDYVRIVGMEITTSDVNDNVFDQTTCTGTGSSDVRLIDCLFGTTNATDDSNYLIQFSAVAGVTISFTNCLFICQSRRGFDGRSSVVTLDHCGIITTRDLCFVLDSGSTVTNTWAVGASSEDFWTGGTAPSGSHNASLDNSAATDYTSTVDIVASVNEFTNPTAVLSTADFTLLDSLLNEAGTGSLTTDITGATRTGTADIGPFNYGAAAAGGPPTLTLLGVG